MDNKLHVFETDTTTSNYENEGAIINFTLGLSGRMYASSAYSLYYGFGINFVPNYDLMITYSTESYNLDILVQTQPPIPMICCQ